MITTFLFFTEPIICMTCVSEALSRRLSTIARSHLKSFAYPRAILIPPTSGETITRFLSFFFSR